jgi:vacuolar-type H+-ATPase subunit F/Vma7
MKHDIAVVGLEDELIGYRMAGIKKAYTPETEGLMEKLSDGKNIVFITSEAKKIIGGRIDDAGADFMVQEIPSPGMEYAEVSKLIIDTVGFDFRK